MLKRGRAVDLEGKTVEVTPPPILTRLIRLDERVRCCVKVTSGVAVRRGIAAPHMPAAHADAKVHPPTSHPQAVFTSLAARHDVTDLIEMRAGVVQEFSQLGDVAHGRDDRSHDPRFAPVPIPGVRPVTLPVDLAGSTAVRQRDLLHMDWFLWMCGLTNADDRVSSEAARPMPHELDLIELLGGLVAKESSCSRCGAPLGRFVQIRPPSAIPKDSWTLRVLTCCQGWRRHKHSATVTECAGDLIFGSFHR
jgi:hypothetical protein